MTRRSYGASLEEEVGQLLIVIRSVTANASTISLILRPRARRFVNYSLKAPILFGFSQSFLFSIDIIESHPLLSQTRKINATHTQKPP